MSGRRSPTRSTTKDTQRNSSGKPIPLGMATKDNILRMGYLAQKLVRGDRCNLLMLGDSQFAPAVEPRIAQTMLRNWDVDWRERVYYGASSSAPSEGFQAFNFPGTSVDAGDSLPDGTTVPAGFDGALYRSYVSNEFGSVITRLRSSNLNNYYGGNWLEGQQIAWKLAVLGGVDPVPDVRVLGRDSAGTVTGVVTTNLGLTANSTWQQVAIETHVGTAEDAQEIYLDTANPNDETGQVFAYGAWSAGIANKVDGLQLSIVARGGDTVSDALPVAEGGSSTTESDLERVTKFNVMDAWPDVILMNFGTNMETDEANDVAGVWRSRVEALIAWYRRLAAENGKASPYFVLMVPWETGSSQARRIATQEAVRKISISSTAEAGPVRLSRAPGADSRERRCGQAGAPCGPAQQQKNLRSRPSAVDHIAPGRDHADRHGRHDSGWSAPDRSGPAGSGANADGPGAM